ncbi:MAG: InlB B-repeat-containing protein, partial [Clostridia bacterium]|nr:InlB B-repeat-containing protein [Clostridia bacterium]
YDGALQSATAPSKTYYNFMGYFTATNGGGTKYYTNTMVTNVGSYTTAGNLTLYADWDPIVYKITYVLNGGTNHSSNPAEYTIESGDITIYAASKSGSIWDGWSGTGLSGKHQSFKIPSGSTGDRTYTANFSAPIGETEGSITSKVGGGSYLSGYPNLATLTWKRSYNASTQKSTIYYTIKVATLNSRGEDLTGTYKNKWYNISVRYVKINSFEKKYTNLLRGADSSSKGPCQGSVIMSNQVSCSSWGGSYVPGSNDGSGTIEVSHPNGGVATLSFLFHVRFNYGSGNTCTYCSVGQKSYEIGPMAS